LKPLPWTTSTFSSSSSWSTNSWSFAIGYTFGSRRGNRYSAALGLTQDTPGQLAIQTALGGYQSIKDLVAPGGRLCRQRDLAHDLLTQIPGVSVVKPKAALYMFPRLDPKLYPIADDQQFAYELLAEEKVLIVQGSGFNVPDNQHFRVVFLPHADDLTEAIGRIARFLDHYKRRHST
jgi:alanine-synthesizing transaminase